MTGSMTRLRSCASFSARTQDRACLNAAQVLYVMGKVSTLCDGIAMARDAIRVSNSEKNAWVTWQNAKPEDG
jgi:anthranilate phosphoribosyltransferase